MSSFSKVDPELETLNYSCQRVAYANGGILSTKKTYILKSILKKVYQVLSLQHFIPCFTAKSVPLVPTSRTGIAFNPVLLTAKTDFALKFQHLPLGVSQAERQEGTSHVKTTQYLQPE